MNLKQRFLIVVLFVLHGVCFSQQTGEAFIHKLFQDKNYEQSYQYLDQIVKEQVSIDDLKSLVTQLSNQFGNFKKIIEINSLNNVYYYYSEFEKTKIDIQVSILNNGKINGFYFTPHKEFEKQKLGVDLNIQNDSLLINGTLLMPENKALKKLVIFVHGSGPQDRDETIAENKPFKNIAEGLYQKGIASFRFDKRTYTHPQSFTEKSTIDDEYTDDILTIISYFKANYSDYEVILLGHSLGGYILPKIANKTKNCSKLILLAANARPLDEVIVEQFEYLNRVSPSPELISEFEKFKKQSQYLHSADFNKDSSLDKLPFGLSFPYWKSLLDYDLKKETAVIKIPVLVLQGERDYQVTMVDFNLWKKYFATNKNASFISYPKLNHIFIKGEGLATPDEYLVKDNVSPDVIKDIETFILK